MTAKTAKLLPLALLLLAACLTACHGSDSTPDEQQQTLTEAENVSRSVNDIAAAQEAAPPLATETAAPVQKAAPQQKSTAVASADEGETEALPDEEESEEAD